MAPTPFNIGAAVFTADGDRVGVIDRVTGVGIVVSHDSDQIEIPVSLIDDQRSTPDELVLHTSADSTRFTVPVHAEELSTDVREVDRGSLRIEKSVEHVPFEKDIDLASDVVDIERIAVDQVFAEKPQTRQDGETLVIPVVEEELILTTRYRVVEEVRVTRQQETRTEHIEADLRREVVDVHRVDAGAEPIDP